MKQNGANKLKLKIKKGKLEQSTKWVKVENCGRDEVIDGGRESINRSDELFQPDA